MLVPTHRLFKVGALVGVEAKIRADEVDATVVESIVRHRVARTNDAKRAAFGCVARGHFGGARIHRLGIDPVLREPSQPTLGGAILWQRLGANVVREVSQVRLRLVLLPVDPGVAEAQCEAEFEKPEKV